jgi:hypothetical protein
MPVMWISEYVRRHGQSTKCEFRFIHSHGEEVMLIGINSSQGTTRRDIIYP